MESKKILMVMALIAILLPSALARRSVVDFETDSAIANDEFSEAETSIPLSDIILEGPGINQRCGVCLPGRLCRGGGRCICIGIGLLCRPF